MPRGSTPSTCSHYDRGRDGSSTSFASARKALRIAQDDFATLGLNRADLDSPDFSACQRIGAHAAFLGYDAIIVPSARADGTNIVIFVGDDGPDELFERVSIEEISR